jgi:hypothetical protein
MKICTIEGCGKKQHSFGLCGLHSSRLRRHGSPLKGRTIEGEIRRFIEMVKRTETDECIIWPYGRNTNGYGRMGVPNEKKTQSVHRVICREVHGEPPIGMTDASHSCGRGADGCINHRHVRWTTHKDNMQEMNVHGTSQRGEKSITAKLRADQIPQIRALRESGLLMREIADNFGVSQNTISQIILGRRWGHV